MEASAQRDARCLIERISREHTLDGAIVGTRFELLLTNCLEVLSSQLYEKSTHFLMELIQNADDNTYNCPSPTLSFSYKPGSLRIDCNEVGFTSENVEALCAISRSTKSGKTSDGEHIGEKGIGFKSVFKAADVVWISSREFTFKFDKTKFLGMVAPIWTEFPETPRPGCTSFYLQLSKVYEEETLIHELLTFDANLLIFLRRIKEINIRVVRRDEMVWEKKIRKVEGWQGVDRMTVLHAGESTFQYLIRTHVIKDLPKEHKRPNWHQTKVLLAFPTAEFPEQPLFVPQNVYAFLPIRNYGLKFLVQADFLLTASREDVESTLPWNRTIRDALAEAFLLSIAHFNEGKLKYVWPYYVPSTSTAASSFLEPAITSILTQLRESPVLESCAGTMVKASSLKHVPLDPFADGEGIPFTLNTYTAASYLSLRYPTWVIEATNSIGVSQLSPQEFLGDLNSTIKQDPTTFRTRSVTWHSQLAETLIKLTTDVELMSAIQEICLIPLNDGTWTSARGQSIFFSKSETSLEFPSGIEVLIIDSSAESDPYRHKLFTNLGVKAWEAPEICRLVLRIHESSDFDPKTLAVNQLISHAAFLYNASWQPPKTADLWFATKQDERCLGRKLYIPGSSETDSAAARIFAQLQKQSAVIHNDYLKAFALDADWPLWLVSNLGLSMIPRLITPHVDPKPQPTQILEIHENATDVSDLFASPSIDENAPIIEDADFDFFDQSIQENDFQQQLFREDVTRTPAPPKTQLSSSVPEDYQMQLMLLEQQNKKRLLMARQEQETPSQSMMPSMLKTQAQQRLVQHPRQATQRGTPKASKPKGPVDVEKQCGVLSPNRVPCARSLTCKSHSMEAKRAVPGRSVPYDMLLAAYQKNQAKQLDAAIQAELDIAPLEDELRANAGSIDSDDVGGWRATPAQDRQRIAQQMAWQGQAASRVVVNDPQSNGASDSPNRTSSLSPQQKSGGTTSSYWSMLEQQDFCNLLRYFGTNWPAIAATMKTKTHIMIRNFYNRKIQEGDFGKQLEEDGARADKMRAEGADMGPLPAPMLNGENPIESSRDKLEGSERVKTAGDVYWKEDPVDITQSAPVHETKKIFSLSEEFAFMFRECHSSDVLQLLRDYWQHYSQWIDGVHMKWQNNDFLESSTQLRNSLGACLVKSATGSLPLQETVLQIIDPQLDKGCLVPAVDIKDPQHPEWTLLSYFGVVTKRDIHYYLRCLIAVSQERRPDVDNVAYIYENIQARYKENEELISAAFYERDIIFVQSESRGSSEPAGWTNLNECLLRDITIETQYPSSSYLFRCLRSPSGDPIAAIVATATLVTSSSELEDISRLFRNISTALKDVNTSKAAQLLRPLQKRSVFPITNGLGKHRYDDLLDVHNTSWFIADRPHIRESFLGKLPLLALPIEDLNALEDLFRVLRLDSRLLSNLATRRTHPKGGVTTHWAYTASLRAKSPFIKALVSDSHHNRTTIVRQLDEVRVSVAADIFQIYTLNLAGTEIHGSPVRGQVSLSYTVDSLNLLMTEDCTAAECPPYELVSLMADACGIEGPNHYSLLYAALSNSSMESISSTFTQQGIYVKGLVLDKLGDRYRAQRGDLIPIPSPFWGSLNRLGGSFRGLPEAMRFDRFQKGESTHDRGGDRRLAMINLRREGGYVVEDVHSRRLVYEDERKTDGWHHVQYLGELMVSKVLQAYLGQLYNPERDWTSRLRSKSGHKPFKASTPCAAFTMRDPKILDQMTAFVIKYGRSQSPNWKETLRAKPPIYHLDLAVSAGSKNSSFVITSSQVERMRKFRMHDNATKPNSDIVVLVRVNDVYSEDLLSVDLFVDPWRLFGSDGLTFEEDWIFRSAIQENSSGSTRKRRKLYAPSVSWAMPANPGMQQNNPTTLGGRRHRETYTYRALGSGNIRLLYLLPGETGDQLQGVINHVPYKSAGTYRALSYVWGTDQRIQELMTPDGVLPITFSLSKALQGLRHKNKAIMLWVDAICINQKNHKEKAQQVRLLPKIFQTAASTYAFLEGDKESDAAIEMLMQVRVKAACDEKSEPGTYTRDVSDSDHEKGSAPCPETDGMRSKHRPNVEDWPKDLPRVPACWNERCIPHPDDGIWTSVGAVFALSWFRRVWVIQEIVAAPNVKIVCGKWIIDWSDLHLAMEIVDREVQLFENDFSHFKSSWEPFLSLAAQREWEARHYRWTLIMLLENFRYAESTFKRDRLFALLGLASDGNEEDFEPDYDSPLESVVLKFAQVFVRQGRGMQLLYRAGLSDQSHRFPSWTPDWTVTRPSNLHDSSGGGLTFAASGPQQAKIKCVPDTDELMVEGYAVDVIESISASSNVEHEWDKYFNEIDAMIDSAVLSPVGDSGEHLKWKVPIAGALYPKVAVTGSLDMQSSYMALRNHIKGTKATEEDRNSVNGTAHSTAYATALGQTAADSFRKESTSYIAALQDTLCGWRFVVTERGYVGVVPNMARIGDAVAILKDGRVPFVLRESAARPGAFRLVRGCYVHCMMNGEGLALQGVVESEFRLH